MRSIKAKDLEGVFLVLVKADREHRQHLPLVRRYFRSVANLCRMMPEREIEIFFSGIYVASKRKNEKRIVTDREYRSANPDENFIFELN